MPDRPTFGDVLNSDLPSVLGLCAAQRSDVAAKVNLACEQLMMDPLCPDEGWVGGYATMLLNLTVSNFTAYAVTPRDTARLIVLDICQRPRRLRNPFYEYLLFGTGAQPKPCQTACCATMQAFDRGTTPIQTAFPTNGPQTIRVFTTNAGDVGRRVVLQGPDANGNEVTFDDPTTGQTAQGEVITIQQPFTASLNQYQNLDGIIKDTTLGRIQIFAVDSSGNETLLTTMMPNETVANYRQYLFNGIPPQCCNTATGIVQVSAQARLEFVPVFNDSDYLPILNIPALYEECQAIKYSRQDTPAAAENAIRHHTKAIALLNGQIDAVEGKVSTVINVPIFGSERARLNPR